MIPVHALPSMRGRTVLESATALPGMASTLLGWFRPLVLIRVVKTLVNFEVKEVEQPESCRGVIQPLTNRELELKPEGQRTWRWVMLHTTQDIQLNLDEEFSIGGVKYRVMGDKGYSDYGFIYYELVQGYTHG